jgi:TolA-binding protein
MQTHEFEHAIDAFTRFIDGYPTNKSISVAYVQRAVANQSLKNLPAAEKDYTEVIKHYPKSKERELALEQRALIRGQQNDNPGMVESFTQLLRDYPTSAAAAKAHFWIGRTAYEAKEYKNAADHLAKARDMDKEHYFERASLPLMLSHYFVEDAPGVAREVDAYLKDGKGKVPVEVLRWLSEQLFDTSSYVQAEKYLKLLAEREDVSPKDLLKLGQTEMKLDRHAEAVKALGSYLESVKEPISRALGLVELAKAQIGAGALDDAQKAVDEAITLQPEGKLNAEARIAAGDIALARNDYDLAAKLYSAVAPNLDDEEITPRALERAVEAYKKAGKDAEAKKALNLLNSRYPEYLQRKKLAK